MHVTLRCWDTNLVGLKQLSIPGSMRFRATGSTGTFHALPCPPAWSSLQSEEEMKATISSTTVRAARPDDFAQWKSLWNGYNAFYGRTDGTALPEQVTNTTWSRFFDAYEPMHAVVAERAERLVGLAHFLLHRSTISVTSVCYLQDLFTVESARGQGVGRALIEEVYRIAAHAGCHRVYWQTHETNAQAIELYDRVAKRSGFIVYRKDL